ncbi:MAG TPA: hypothetical protein VGM83_09370 [Devosiaceae bacterium]|jgi:hypothetical protein
MSSQDEDSTHDPEMIAELQELYEELHLVSERAATLLRLCLVSRGPPGDLLQEFRAFEARAAAIWKRIGEVSTAQVPI